jgi:hypothetical protein
MNRKPLIIDSGNVQQLQGSDELDLPLLIRFNTLQAQFRSLLLWMASQGMDLPLDLLDESNRTI